MLLAFNFTNCRSKPAEQNGESGSFPVLSYLQSQVRHVDTSLYSIIKITKRGGVQDTTYLRREDFKAAAHDFLSLPDIAATNLKKAYTETKLYDEDLKKIILTYVPKDRIEATEIVRQDVLIEPNAGSGDQVQTIYTETVLDNKDSTVQKKLTWNTGGSFQVIRITTKRGQPEAVETTDVTWSNRR